MQQLKVLLIFSEGKKKRFRLLAFGQLLTFLLLNEIIMKTSSA